jgi:hypothetical protein
MRLGIGTTVVHDSNEVERVHETLSQCHVVIDVVLLPFTFLSDQ